MKLFVMMSAALLVAVLVVFLFYKAKPPEQTPSFLPGMYVNQAENEFCRIVDTLVIQKTTLAGSGYQITRKSAFQRIRQGDKRPVEYQQDQWQAGYDPAHGALLPTSKAPELVYSAKKNIVFNGDCEYEKVQ